MAQTVVDALEAIEVNEHDGGHAGIAPGQHLAQPVAQQQSVRKSGQRIVGGLMRKLFRRGHAVGDVVEHQHHAFGATRSVEQRTGTEPECARRPLAPGSDRDMPGKRHGACAVEAGARQVREPGEHLGAECFQTFEGLAVGLIERTSAQGFGRPVQVAHPQLRI